MGCGLFLHAGLLVSQKSLEISEQTKVVPSDRLNERSSFFLPLIKLRDGCTEEVVEPAWQKTSVETLRFWFGRASTADLLFLFLGKIIFSLLGKWQPENFKCKLPSIRAVLSLQKEKENKPQTQPKRCGSPLAWAMGKDFLLPVFTAKSLWSPQRFREGSNSAGLYTSKMFMGWLDFVLHYLSLVSVVSDNIFLEEKGETLRSSRWWERWRNQEKIYD